MIRDFFICLYAPSEANVISPLIWFVCAIVWLALAFAGFAPLASVALFFAYGLTGAFVFRRVSRWLSGVRASEKSFRLVSGRHLAGGACIKHPVTHTFTFRPKQ